MSIYIALLSRKSLIYTSLFAQIAATKQIKQHTKLINNYDKSKNLLNTALRSWRTVLILSPNCMKILCNCRRASFANSIHKLFSEAVNLFKKLAVRISIWLLTGRNPKLTWHSLTTFDEPVRKSFMKMRVNLNSNDKVWRASNGHASTAYSKIGIVRHATGTQGLHDCRRGIQSSQTWQVSTNWTDCVWCANRPSGHQRRNTKRLMIFSMDY